MLFQDLCIFISLGCTYCVKYQQLISCMFISQEMIIVASSVSFQLIKCIIQWHLKMSATCINSTVLELMLSCVLGGDYRLSLSIRRDHLYVNSMIISWCLSYNPSNHLLVIYSYSVSAFFTPIIYKTGLRIDSLLGCNIIRRIVLRVLNRRSWFKDKTR